MSDFKITKSFEGDDYFKHYKEAEAYKEFLSSICEQQGLALTPLRIEIDDYYSGHRYTVGYEVILDCENEHQFNAIKLLL